jgi:hypothetical protein
MLGRSPGIVMKKKGIHPESGLSSARALRRFALLICLVIAWEGLGRFLELRTDMVPTPSRVALEAFRHASELQRHLLSTVSGAGAGLQEALLPKDCGTCALLLDVFVWCRW